MAALSTLAAHGMRFVPLEYKTTLGIQSGLEEAKGKSLGGWDIYCGFHLLQFVLILLTGLEYRDLMGQECRLRLNLNLLLYKGNLSVKLSTKSLSNEEKAWVRTRE